MNTLDSIDDSLREIADKYGDSSNKGELFSVLKLLKNKILKDYASESKKTLDIVESKYIDSSTNDVEEGLKKRFNLG